MLIEKIPHADCGSSDALQVWENDGKFDGYCFSCDTYVADPYGDNPPEVKERPIKTPEMVEAELREIDELITVDLPSRKLDKEFLEVYGVKVALSEADGCTPVAAYFPYFQKGERTGYKVRILEPKKMWATGTVKDCDLFGWDVAVNTGARKLFITEGELDCVALYQALVQSQRGTQWEHLTPAVVSLRSGATGAVRELTAVAHELRRTFKDIVLVFDQDEPGQAATAEVLQVFPEAWAVSLPANDPNACVMEGRTKALTKAVLFRAEKPKNTRLVPMSEFVEKARQPAVMGLSWPWPGLTKLTRGIRFGETYYLGAGVKMGKSELVNAIAAHLVTAHGLSVLLAKPEEASVHSTKLMAGKVAGRIFHDPDREFDYEAFDQVFEETDLGEKVLLLDLYQHLGWDTLRADIVEAVQQGVKAVFIDPITNLTNGVDSSNANTQLQEIAQHLAAMAKDLDIVVFIFCHLKAPDYGDSHERGGKVLSHQFSGSRAMMRSCHMMLGLQGNKDPELPLEERNIRELVVLEERTYGVSGSIPLYWDHQTGLFHELKGKKE
jgi:twinkle protein